MRTGKFAIGVVGIISVVSLAGCRSGYGRCRGGACEAPAVPMAGGGQVAGSPAMAQTRYGGQITCPVAGVALAGVSNPIPVAVRGQTVFVCCANCAAKLKADPDAYLARVAAERSGSSAAPRAASASGPYGGQSTCPVTGEPLDPSGGAVPVTVRGQTVYVCCQSCAKKVRNNPDTYLARAIAERAASTASH